MQIVYSYTVLYVYEYIFAIFKFGTLQLACLHSLTNKTIKL